MNRKLMTALCPGCGEQLYRVRNPAGSMLNDDQFDAVKAGDWRCMTCPPMRKNRQHRYWKDEEVKWAVNEGTFAIIPVGEEIRVGQITAEDTGEHDTEIVRYPDGPADKLKHEQMVLLETDEKVDAAMHYLFQRVEKYAQRAEKVFGLLKDICDEIRRRDSVAPEFFREQQKRPTTDEEMATEILNWLDSTKLGGYAHAFQRIKMGKAVVVTEQEKDLIMELCQKEGLSVSVEKVKIVGVDCYEMKLENPDS